MTQGLEYQKTRSLGITEQQTSILPSAAKLLKRTVHLLSFQFLPLIFSKLIPIRRLLPLIHRCSFCQSHQWPPHGKIHNQLSVLVCYVAWHRWLLPSSVEFQGTVHCYSSLYLTGLSSFFFTGSLLSPSS